MSRSAINNGDSGLAVRAALNANFQELYSGCGFLRLQPNLWYPPVPFGTYAPGASAANNSVRAVLALIREKCTISALGARVTTGGTGSTAFAIYASSPTTGFATGAPLATAPGVSNATAGLISSNLVTPVQLDAGLYWFAINQDLSATYQMHGGTQPALSWVIGGTQTQVSAAATSSLSFIVYTQTYGSWPDLTGVTPSVGTAQSYATVFFQVQSVP